MRVFCVVALFTASTLMTPLTVVAASGPTEAQYLSGTEKGIPPDTEGSLDLTDPGQLHFQYGKDLSFQLPYTKIKSYEFTRAKGETRSIVHVPVPKMPFLSHQKVLNLSYFGEKDELNTVSFRLTGRDLSSLEWVLSQHVEDGKKSSDSAGRTKLPESWWGDKNWRTNRNKASWPEPPADAVATR